jgi:hypothetical protein
MAQWVGAFQGHTHETKVKDVGASLKKAIAAYSSSANVAERDAKFKAMHHLAERVLMSRLKAIRAHLAQLREPGSKQRSNEKTIARFELDFARLQENGIEGVLKEFGVVLEK